MKPTAWNFKHYCKPRLLQPPNVGAVGDDLALDNLPGPYCRFVVKDRSSLLVGLWIGSKLGLRLGLA